MNRVRTAAAVAAGLVVVAIVAGSAASADADEQSASTGATPDATECDEAAVREAIVNSQAATPDFEVLDLGTSVCPADAGIPADVAAQIAPPGHNPAGDCPTSAGPPPDAAAVPGAATIIRVGPGGGSGEVQLTWEAVPNATGYRVLRSDAADGQFEVAAEFDITTGTATAAVNVVNVFSEQHSYVPPRGTLEAPDQSSRFSYVDVGADQRCFRVIAFNASGDGPASAVGCGAPPGVELEPATPVAAEPTFTG